MNAAIIGDKMRFVYFSILFATAYWFRVSLVRWLLAKRRSNLIVETQQRKANVKALERAWSVEQSKLDDEQQ